MTIKGKARKIKQKMDKLKAELGNDPCIIIYAKRVFNVVECLWYTSTYVDSKTKQSTDCIVLLPYIQDRQHLSWTEDKITFETIEQATKFCELIGCKLTKYD